MKVHGIVEAIKDNGPVKGKYGTQYRISICIEDDWYGGFFSKSAVKLGVDKGAEVSFVCVQKGDFLNIDPKSFKVIEATLDSNQDSDEDEDEDEEDAAAARKARVASPSKPAAPGYQSKNDIGIKVGHAINNAVQLAIASGDSSITNIAKLAKEVLALSVVLGVQAQAVIDEPRSVLREAIAKPKPAAVAEPIEEDESEDEVEEVKEEAPERKVKAKKTVAPPSFDDFEDDLPF